MLATGLAPTFLNPHVYLDTVVLLGTLANQQHDGRWLFGAGAVAASTAWFSASGSARAAWLGCSPRRNLADPGLADRGHHADAWRLVGAHRALTRPGSRQNRVVADSEPDSDRPLGRRESKKLRTRQAIRREAFRLF